MSLIHHHFLNVTTNQYIRSKEIKIYTGNQVNEKCLSSPSQKGKVCLVQVFWKKIQQNSAKVFITFDTEKQELFKKDFTNNLQLARVV